MNPEWMEHTVCPDDRAPLQRDGDGASCPECGTRFPAADGAVVLLPADEAEAFEPSGDGPEASPSALSELRRRFVETVYLRHNDSPLVRDALERVLDELGPGDWGLNVGSGSSTLHSRVVNLDLSPHENVDVLGTADRLPFASDSFRCLVSQEVFEHLTDPAAAADEAYRVLEPGGVFYLQVPFLIGYHSLPHDYWRFTAPGLTRLLTDAGFEIAETEPAVGAGTSAYRVGVEFMAALGSSVSESLYQPVKGLAALSLAPLRLADRVTADFGEHNRIPGGFYAIARKPGDAM